jgi:hypothetical protein
VRVCNISILAGIVFAVGLALIYKILWKSRVFLDFFRVLYRDTPPADFFFGSGYNKEIFI